MVFRAIKEVEFLQSKSIYTQLCERGNDLKFPVTKPSSIKVRRNGIFEADSCKINHVNEVISRTFIKLMFITKSKSFKVRIISIFPHQTHSHYFILNDKISRISLAQLSKQSVIRMRKAQPSFPEAKYPKETFIRTRKKESSFPCAFRLAIPRPRARETPEAERSPKGPTRRPAEKIMPEKAT